MKNFLFEVGADGVAIAQFNVPGQSMNTITFDVQDDLDLLADRLRSDDGIVGLVLHSGKASGLCAGADLVEMEGAIDDWRRAKTQEELRAGVGSAGRYSSRLRALETAGKPIAVIVSGVALGGGLELALACHRRIASGDADRLRLGLPEVTIGLMPGAGGTQRLPRLMGLDRSAAVILDGRPLELADAVAAGVVHEHIADPVAALEAAKSWVLANRDAVQPWDVKGYQFVGGPHTPASYARFPLAIAKTVGDGPHDHAARGNILRALYEGAMVSIDAALRIESRYFFNTARAFSSAAMVRTLFHGRQSVAKAGRKNLAPYGDRLRQAWGRAIDGLVLNGEDRRFVVGVARHLAPMLSPPPIVEGPLSVHPTDEWRRAAIANRLLSETADEAAGCLDDGLLLSQAEADVAAIEAGYPAFTGGPLTFRRAEYMSASLEADECGTLHGHWRPC
ncbi:MAG: enoyl-CoA hydratase-related protein [Novosphingobium sp.]